MQRLGDIISDIKHQLSEANNDKRASANQTLGQVTVMSKGRASSTVKPTFIPEFTKNDYSSFFFAGSLCIYNRSMLQWLTIPSRLAFAY